MVSYYQEVSVTECNDCDERRPCVGMPSGDFAASTPFLCKRCLREYIQLIEIYEEGKE